MQLKTARRGRNAGSQFWSCPNWKTSEGCKRHTIDHKTWTQSSNGKTEPEAGASFQDSVDLPRVVVAQQLHEGLDTVYFDFLTVPLAVLEDTSDSHAARHRVVGAQWRMSYGRATARPHDPATARALSVADKLICRGHITLLPEELENRLSRTPTPATYDSGSSSPPSLDSEDEALFWTRILPMALGPLFRIWCTPQVEISTLTGSADFSTTEQRVDFLVAHPSLERPIVVEVDGVQHSGQREGDAMRDSHLKASGFSVVRIPAYEVRAGSGTTLNSLVETLFRLERAEAFANRLSSPIRRGGQVQVALLNAIYAGLVPLGGFSVASDLVLHGELTASEFDAVVSDLADLLQRLGRLYGARSLGEGIRVSADDAADLELNFLGPVTGNRSIFIEDAYLPISIKWPSRPVQAGSPAAFDQDTIRYFLNRIFRKSEFLDGQYDIIARALKTKDTVALLPTGAGKSIAFQLAGMLLPGRTIVIAPIISLIRDQVENLRSYGVSRALGITGDLSGRGGRDLAYALLKNGEAFFYYIAPERFQIEEFREKLRGMTAAFPVNMVVVDEAHCVSEWGHDFRTAYLRIGQTSRECSTSARRAPVLVALTGTASRAVLRDLQRELQISEFDAVVTPTTLDRPELQFFVLHEKSEHKQFVLESYLRNALPAAFGLPPESFFRRDGDGTYCGLIFCPNVNGTSGVVDVAKLLSDAGIDAAYYAGTRPKSFWGTNEDWRAYKRDTERRFKRDELSILVATKAFGMGVDKPNVRFTVHYGLPASIEAFYQEAGRAGRNRDMAVCTVIVSDDRRDKNRQLLAPATSIEEIARFVQHTSYKENDDVTRMLFFHVQAFKGVEVEIAVVKQIHSALVPTGEHATRSVTFGPDSKLTEKALHRLVVVGVVADYTVNYSARSFSVLLADANRRTIIERYAAYVEGYQVSRAQQERQKADALPKDWNEFVIGVVRLYVQFVYDVIERGQRRAIAEMLAACQAGSGEELRRRILNYLEQAEFSEAMERILSDARAGLGIIAELLAEIVSPNDAARLRGPVARSLETYPDHPGLLLLRAATEALSRDGDDQTIRENFDAFLTNAAEAYGLSDTELSAATGAVLRAVGRRNTSAVQLIEQLLVQRIRSRPALRMLVAESGIAAAQISPWLLLDATSSGIDRYTP